MSFNSSCTGSEPRSHCRCWRHWVTANVRTPPCVPMCTRSDVNTNVNCPLCEQFPNTRETRHSIVHCAPPTCVAPQACNCHQIRLNRQHNEHFTGKTNKGCRDLHCQHIRRPFYLFWTCKKLRQRDQLSKVTLHLTRRAKSRRLQCIQTQIPNWQFYNGTAA